MSSKGRIVCFGICSLMLITLAIPPALGQTTDDRQPNPENATMYLWGDSALANGDCINHFSSDDSSEFGFGDYISAYRYFYHKKNRFFAFEPCFKIGLQLLYHQTRVEILVGDVFWRADLGAKSFGF